MTIRKFTGKAPALGHGVYIDPQACVIGDVTIGDDSSIWPFCSARGDVNSIVIGKRTNIQDSSTLHATHDSHYHPGGIKVTIGDDVTVGHQVILHACTIKDRCLIGMGSIIMDETVVGSDTIIGAGSLVTQGTELEGGYLYIGRPARRLRELTEDEKERITYSAGQYVKLKNQYPDLTD